MNYSFWLMVKCILNSSRWKNDTQSSYQPRPVMELKFTMFKSRNYLNNLYNETEEAAILDANSKSNKVKQPLSGLITRKWK